MTTPRRKASLSVTITSAMVEVRKIGAAVRELCRNTGFDAVAIYHCELAVVEAANNIIKHAYRGEPGHRIEFTGTVLDDRIILSLADSGRPADPRMMIPSPPKTEGDGADDLPQGKLGLFLIHSIMDEVRISSDGGENRLTMVRKFSSCN